jgi:hypothetical protein
MRRSDIRLIVALTSLTAFFALSATGCYAYYQPVNTDLTGHQVQLSITDSGAVILAPQVGVGIESVDGRLVTDSAARYLVSVSGTRRRDGLEADWRGERLYVPHALVASISERRFSRARTTLFVAATTIAMIAIKQAFGGAGGANAPGGSTGNGGGPR